MPYSPTCVWCFKFVGPAVDVGGSNVLAQLSQLLEERGRKNFLPCDRLQSSAVLL